MGGARHRCRRDPSDRFLRQFNRVPRFDFGKEYLSSSMSLNKRIEEWLRRIFKSEELNIFLLCRVSQKGMGRPHPTNRDVGVRLYAFSFSNSDSGYLAEASQSDSKSAS